MAPNQFTAVAIVTTLGWAIYGIYIQTNGPIVKEKFTINKSNPINIIPAAKLKSTLININPVPTIAVVTMFKRVPTCIIGFLPTQDKIVDKTRGAITWIKFINIGKIDFKDE